MFFEEVIELDWVDCVGEDLEDDEVVCLLENWFFGLGGMVDKLMNFWLFKVDEWEELIEDESDYCLEDEIEEEVR